MTYTPPSSSSGVDMSYTDKYAATSTSSAMDHYTDKYAATSSSSTMDHYTDKYATTSSSSAMDHYTDKYAATSSSSAMDHYTDKYAATSSSSAMDHYTDKYSSSNGNGLKDKPFLYSDSYDITSKYSSALSYTKPNYDDSIYTSTSASVTSSYKSPYTSSTSGYASELKFNGKSLGTYESSGNGHVGGQASSGLLGVEETPTPTSSIETEDSITREVGEKDVEGDGELSD